MHQRLLFGSLLLALAGGTWCLWPRGETRSSTAVDREAETPRSAREQLQRAQRRATASARGDKSLNGIVTLSGVAVAEARVRAFVAAGAGGSSGLICPCDGQTMLDVFALACNCDEAEPLMLAAIDNRALVAPVAETKTNERGEFVIHDLADLELDLVAAHPLGGIGSQEQVRPNGEPVHIELGAGHHVRGRVFDDEGAAISDATVSVVSEMGVELEALTTNAVGEFTVRVPRQLLYLAATATGYLPTFEIVEANWDEVELELTAPGAAAGVVIDEKNRPLAGVSVTLRGYGERHELVTADDGTFAFTGLTPDDYYLIAQRAELVAGKSFALLPRRSRDDLALVLRPRRVGEIRGQVKDERGNLLAATVILSGDLSWGRDRATTDARGTFSFTPVPPGYYEVFAEAPGYGRVCSTIDLDLDFSNQAEVTFILAPQTDSEGLVVDHRGRAVPRAVVSVEPIGVAPDDDDDSAEIDQEDAGDELIIYRRRLIADELIEFDDEENEDDEEDPDEAAGEDEDARNRWTISAADSDCEPVEMVTDQLGHFRLPGLAPGTYELSVAVGDALPHLQEVHLPARNLRVVLPAAAQARGLALDAQGNPAPFADLHLESAELSTMLVTDAFGAFITPPLFTGHYTLTAALARRLGLEQELQLSFRMIGDELNDLVVRLPATVTLEVRAVDRAGQSVAPLFVEATDEADDAIAEAVDEQGGAALELLAGRRYQVRALSPGYQPAQLQLAAGAESITVVLDPDPQADSEWSDSFSFGQPGDDDLADLSDDDEVEDDVDLWEDEEEARTNLDEDDLLE